MRTNHPHTMSGAGFVPIALAAAVAAPALGQWSSDPMLNLCLADRPGEQVQPKIVTLDDGGCYVSWYDNATGGYDPTLQRLNAQGEELWDHNGILVADRSYSWTMDYGLGLDATGNALLAFRDDRSGSDQITAARIDPDGNLLWGAMGVQVTEGIVAEFIAAPKITGLTDGTVIVAWTSDNDARLQKLDADGTPLWDPPLTVSDPNGGTISVSDMHACSDNTFIISFVRQGPMMWDPRHLWAQKYDADGTALWGLRDNDPLVIFDGGTLQMGNFPYFDGDGADGAIFGWYEVGPFHVRAQHVLADGTEVFGHNGTVGSTTQVRYHVEPGVAYNQATGELFMFWKETNVTQTMQGWWAQKLDATGARQWGETGLQLVPLGSWECTHTCVVPWADGAIASYSHGQGWGNDELKAVRLDTNGNHVWADEFIAVSSAPAEKSRISATLRSDGGTALIVWHDDRTGVNDVFIQNVNGDGTLGGGGMPEDVNGDGVVDVLDLLAVIAAWGNPGGPEDVNGDGVVDVLDLLAVIAAWS